MVPRTLLSHRFPSTTSEATTLATKVLHLGTLGHFLEGTTPRTSSHLGRLALRSRSHNSHHARPISDLKATQSLKTSFPMVTALPRRRRSTSIDKSRPHLRLPLSLTSTKPSSLTQVSLPRPSAPTSRCTRPSTLRSLTTASLPRLGQTKALSTYLSSQ